MTRNLGTADRIIRAGAGAVLILVALLTDLLTEPAWLSIAAIVVGLVLVATSAVSFCPLYRIVGIRSCRV